MKFGFDIHGVLDTFPQFPILTHALLSNGHEVHIITGNQKTEKIVKELRDLNVTFYKFFSVADYLIENGYDHYFSAPSNPWFESDVWNCQKGYYASRVGLDFHFDDMEEYKPFFPDSCVFCLIK